MIDLIIDVLIPALNQAVEVAHPVKERFPQNLPHFCAGGDWKQKPRYWTSKNKDENSGKINMSTLANFVAGLILVSMESNPNQTPVQLAHAQTPVQLAHAIKVVLMECFPLPSTQSVTPLAKKWRVTIADPQPNSDIKSEPIAPPEVKVEVKVDEKSNDPDPNEISAKLLNKTVAKVAKLRDDLEKTKEDRSKIQEKKITEIENLKAEENIAIKNLENSETTHRKASEMFYSEARSLMGKIRTLFANANISPNYGDETGAGCNTVVANLEQTLRNLKENVENKIADAERNLANYERTLRDLNEKVEKTEGRLADAERDLADAERDLEQPPSNPHSEVFWDEVFEDIFSNFDPEHRTVVTNHERTLCDLNEKVEKPALRLADAERDLANQAANIAVDARREHCLNKVGQLKEEIRRLNELLNFDEQSSDCDLHQYLPPLFQLDYYCTSNSDLQKEIANICNLIRLAKLRCSAEEIILRVTRLHEQWETANAETAITNLKKIINGLRKKVDKTESDLALGVEVVEVNVAQSSDLKPLIASIRDFCKTPPQDDLRSQLANGIHLLSQANLVKRSISHVHNSDEFLKLRTFLQNLQTADESFQKNDALKLSAQSERKNSEQNLVEYDEATDRIIRDLNDEIQSEINKLTGMKLPLNVIEELITLMKSLPEDFYQLSISKRKAFFEANITFKCIPLEAKTIVRSWINLMSHQKLSPPKHAKQTLKKKLPKWVHV
jgi:CII-binding regulator of phage lambda lysogenization HflD